MSDSIPYQETFVRFVPAKVFARASGFPEAEGEEIAGHFLLKRQGSRMVLWEIHGYTRGVATQLTSIGPVTQDDYCLLVERNFR